MPRMGRIVLPNYPHHVVQRGHNRQLVFAAEQDYQRYISDLRELKEVFGIKVYAYCQMTNHVHLLVAPGESVAGLGQLMKALAARATRYRNRLRYMEFMRQVVPVSEIDLIRAALQRGQLTGGARFVDEIESIRGQRVELRGQGRPKRQPRK